MNIFILFVTLISVVLTQKIVPRRDENWPPKAFKDFHKIYHEPCLAESGTTKEAIQEFSDGDIHDDPTLKCYMKCLLVQAGTIEDDGRINPVPILNAIQSLSEEDQIIILKMGSKCAGIHHEDVCEEAFLLNKCLKEADPVNYFIL